MIIQIEPWIDKEELNQLKRVIDSKFVTENELTKEFEKKIARLAGVNYAIAITNGTLATYCIIKAMDIGPGDEIIVPNMTFISTANSVILAGAKPVLCDIYEDTFCIDFDKAQKLVNSKTKAIMPVHLYGQSADMEKCRIFAKKNNLKIIEDAAQGIGVKFNGQHVGSFGNAGVLSFYGNKIITTGEGGIILTNDKNIANKCYSLKNHGRQKKGVFIHENIGFNFSFTEMQAAIGISQLKKLDRIRKKKNEIYKTYHAKIKKISGVSKCFIDKRTKPFFWFTSFLIEDCDNLQKYLLHNKIQTRRFFYPLHMQPCYKNRSNLIGNLKGKFLNTIKIYDMGLSLPSSYNLTKSEQKIVYSKILNYYQK